MEPDRTVAELLEEAMRVLQGAGETPLLDAQLILGRVLSRPRTWILAHPEAALSPDQATQARRMAARRAEGCPLPYLLGEWEFYGLSFEVTPDVLIPRPETELLVDLALARLTALDRPARVLDVGTGSGCIAIAIAARFPRAAVAAVDLSQAALAVAQRNARRHGLDTMEWIRSDLFAALENSGRRFDLIVSNPPYIPAGMLAELAVSRFEPALALDGGPDGLAVIRALLSRAGAFLETSGQLLVEIEASQGEAARSLAREVFPDRPARIHPDLAGRDRVLQIDAHLV